MIVINAKYDVTDLPVVIDVNGEVWRLPFTDARGRKFKPKKLKLTYHLNHVGYRINNTVVSEKKIESLRVENARVIRYVE